MLLTQEQEQQGHVTGITVLTKRVVCGILDITDHPFALLIPKTKQYDMTAVVGKDQRQRRELLTATLKFLTVIVKFPKKVDTMDNDDPIKLVDIWNQGPNIFRWKQTVNEINKILDDAANGLLDCYSALGFIDSCLSCHGCSTHKTIVRIGEDCLLNSNRDLSASRDCQRCRIILPADIKTDREQLTCYNGERWIKIPISKPPPQKIVERY